MPNQGDVDRFPLAAEPPQTADERHTLVTFLDYFRSVLLRKVTGLNAGELGRTLGNSTLTLAGLLKHMALVEDHWFSYTWLGEQDREPWASIDWKESPDWDFLSASSETPDALVEMFSEAVDRSRNAIADVDEVDGLAARESRNQAVTLRWILVHMIEEYARHCGHADLIRESIDGKTGD
jgi:uncharacterized damage-inducible protein DinB